MLYFTRARTLGIMAICALGILLSLPNLSARPKFLPSFIPWTQVHLGLDLRGGSYLLLQLDFNAVVQQDLNTLVDETRQAMRGAGLGYTGLHADPANDRVVLQLLSPSDAPAAQAALAKLITYGTGNAGPNAAVNISAAGSVSVTIPQAALIARKSQAVDQSITIIQRRIDGSGVLNPQIARQGEDEIVVQLPGVSDPDRIRTLIGTTAHMTFQLVDTSATPGQPVPLGDEMLPMQDDPNQQLVVFSNVSVDGADLNNAQASTDPQSGQWVINFSLNSLGAREFADVTTANVGKPFAIILDGKIIMAPNIREPITGGSGQITGNYTRTAFARRRPARPAQHHRRTKRRPRAWSGCHQGRRVVAGRGLRAGAGLHGDILRPVRVVREYRTGDEPGHHAGDPILHGCYAHLARHGRHPAHSGHGGRRQRFD
jgi:protein-export membrane protein SecD